MSLVVTIDLLQSDGFDAGGGEIYKYQNQPFTGILIEYYENGNVLGEEEFKNGHREGVQRTYFQNNQKEEEFYIKYNRLDGIFRRWDISGKLLRETIWKDGSCIGDSGLL